jgi:hypothetical protein
MVQFAEVMPDLVKENVHGTTCKNAQEYKIRDVAGSIVGEKFLLVEE